MAVDDVATALASTLPGHEVVEVTRLSAGASRHTFTVQTASDEGVRRLVLQVDRLGALPGAVDVAAQVVLLQAARRAGVPVPEVVAWGESASPFGGPFVLATHVAGETLPQRILREPSLADARRGLAADAGRVLGALHGVPTGELPALPGEDELDRVTRWLREVGDPVPAFELALVWLREDRPSVVAPRLVHGDFRLGNVVVGPDGIRAVLDWEMAHLGDPAEDLAWLTLRAWRFRGRGEVAGTGSVPDLLASYDAVAPEPVDPARLRWWQVLGTLKWGAICQRQARAHLDGHTRSVELAAIGRRVAECEHDVLELLP